jgi:hypothetical protein
MNSLMPFYSRTIPSGKPLFMKNQILPFEKITHRMGEAFISPALKSV